MMFSYDALIIAGAILILAIVILYRWRQQEYNNTEISNG